MKEETARTIADVVIVAAALGAAVVILRVPTLRRLAFAAARSAIAGGIPAWLAREIQQAWGQSARGQGPPPERPLL